MDEAEEVYNSDNESKESSEEGSRSARSASPPQPRDSSAATGDDKGSNLNLLDRRRSVFSADPCGSRSTSARMTTGAMPEISIRRRTRVAGVGDDGNTAGTIPSNDPGAIARASRIIAELEQDLGGLNFPLDALRRDSQGFEADDDNDE